MFHHVRVEELVTNQSNSRLTLKFLKREGGGIYIDIR